MANTFVDCPLLDNRLPPGGSFGPFRAAFEPGKVTLDAPVTLASWAAGNFGGVGGKDYLFAVDGRPLFRSQGERVGIISADAVDSSNPGGGVTKRFSIVVDWPAYGWRPGRHLLTFGLVLASPAGSNRVAYSSTFALDVPASPMAPQTPSPCLVPGKILRNLFFLGPQYDPAQEPGLTAQALRDAGVNCLTVSGFSRPGAATYAQWRADWDNTSVPYWTLGLIDWAIANGFYVLVEMDGLYRSVAERQWWDTCPWRDDAVRHVRDTFAARRPWVAAVSGNDECIWQDAAGHALPPIDTRALHTLWREHPDAPPWAWPGPNPQPYETADQADFAIRYVTGTGAEFSSKLSASGLGWSLAQRARAFDTMRLRPPPPAGWPLATSAFCMSGNYQKLTDGCFMQPMPSPDSGDVVLDEQVLPAQAAAAAWLPLVFLRPLPAMLRGYYFDTRGDRVRRGAAAKQAAGMLQQGVVYGTDLWRAFGRAWKSIGDREQILTSRTPLPAAYLDNWAAGGVDGLKVAVNCANFARPNPYFGRGALVFGASETPYRGEDVPPGGVVLSC